MITPPFVVAMYQGRPMYGSPGDNKFNVNLRGLGSPHFYFLRNETCTSDGPNLAKSRINTGLQAGISTVYSETRFQDSWDTNQWT